MLILIDLQLPLVMLLDLSFRDMSDVVRSILARYGESLTEKLIMQTYDGASVMSGQIGGLKTLMHHEYPFAFFFHCAAHRLNLFLCQSASTLPSVKFFLQISVHLVLHQF